MSRFGVGKDFRFISLGPSAAKRTSISTHQRVKDLIVSASCILRRRQLTMIQLDNLRDYSR